ncbi:hypothetical protein GCM10011309_24600 [Litorimonas cladophorae]|uniref:Uncharacterized protein n=1 Tax=Litorimonas cladophorae TaxID=1220491 RepID=A0A918NJZ6_9PROT|nr:hypothetical protein [Litorimonas cladophorae]GGX73603.1 hypothetical protein GCM10011309_24600 [Litorimonas cladophorae]
MPAHYAISEAFITLAALYCGWKLFTSGYKFAAIGTLLFGAAAAIGIYRFPSGKVEELAHIHAIAGQLGGLAGIGLIASEFLRLALPQTQRKLATPIALGLLLTCLIIAGVSPAHGVPFFLAWSVIAMGAAFALPSLTISRRIIYALIAGGMLLNVILFRQSPHLSAAVSWHVFHTLVAIWLVAIFFLFKKQTARRPT